MRAPASVKQDFLKKWVNGLQLCSKAKQDMGVLERKKAIKLSADIAIACTRNGRTHWSRALIANASKQGDNKVLVGHLLAPECERLKKASMESTMPSKQFRSKKILKKSCRARRVMMKRRSSKTPQVALAKSIATRMVKKRTQVLKTLVPGGEFMDDISLIQETLDYIMFLRAQVDGMTAVAKASEAAIRK
ncbi:hypothetical protein K2173_016043 [Erythroxylum novogranatense]|uniref:IBH1-like N-terminal domain-containing protein n=1 Tax=Erythroxylum novogranatense TaxID=1862640 RepID=A0AAV8SF25_9ROSI|nr:hypothetical protein K2173_016043 [Erythroxylum novogranatense]